MGVIKNLWVRIGGDASGAVRSFKTASTAGTSAKESIKKSSAESKRSIREAFSSSVPSIKKYREEVTQTKSAYQTATQNIDRLKDKINQLTSIYNTVKGATAGLDLSKPLEELMVDAEKNLTAIESRRRKIESELAALGSGPKATNSKRTATLPAELTQLAEKSRFAEARMADLDRRANQIGFANIDYASVKGLQQLEQQLNSAKNELNTTQMVADETGRKLKTLGVAPTVGRALKGIGTAAAQAASTGVKKLWSGLKNVAGSAARGIAALPGKLRSIGKSASAGCGGLTKMVRSIRNIGIASLGMRVASGMFGRLRSIIGNYISQNEELNASVEAMKNQMGAALAPAINLVLNAMQRLMPVVTAVSNAIGSVFTALFGKVSATGKAITATAESASAAAEGMGVLGFDQITKEEESGDASNTTAQITEQSGVVKKLTAWIQELKAAFAAGDWMKLGQIVGDGINSIVESIDSLGIGAKVGTFANNLFTALHRALTSIDFFAIGSKLGKMLSETIKQIDWGMTGQTIGAAFTALPSVLVGFILDTDWATVGQSLSTLIGSTLDSVTEWIKSVDWLQIGQCIADFIANVDWAGLATSLFECLGAALGAAVGVLWGCIDDAVQAIKEYFSEKINAAGGNIVQGLLNGVVDGLANIGRWIKENIFDPFINGFKGILPAIKGPINSIINFINKMISGICEGINTIIRAMNKLKWDIPDWVPLLGGKTFGFNLKEISAPQIPLLAKGGVVTEPTTAIIGEKGKEAVMPLENNTGWITKLAQQINQQNSGGTKSLSLAIYFRTRKIAEYVVQDINQITRETGVCPIYV